MVSLLVSSGDAIVESFQKFNSSDLIIALIAAVVGAFSGAFFGVFGNIVQTKMGEAKAKVLRTSVGIEKKGGNNWNSIELFSVILLENNKMIPVSFYHWKADIYTDVDVISCEMLNEQAGTPKFLDVVTLQPHESKQIALKCTVDLKKHIMFARKIHKAEMIEMEKEKYTHINKVILKYNASFKDKSINVKVDDKKLLVYNTVDINMSLNKN